MPKPSTPAIWASGKAFGFQPSSAQQAQGFDYIAVIRPGTGAPITDDHDWPLNQVTQALKWVMDQIPDAGIKSAAFRDVGEGANQIPDMSYWSYSGASLRVPGGKIFKFGLVSGRGSKTFSTPFPNSCSALVFGQSFGPNEWVFSPLYKNLSRTGFDFICRGYGGSTIQDIGESTSYIAIGD